MQFPKELQLGNLDPEEPVLLIASMKCSSRRNCNDTPAGPTKRTEPSLNEVQFPKELQHAEHVVGELDARASMKCSSRRNCNVKATEDDDYVNPPQ